MTNNPMIREVSGFTDRYLAFGDGRIFSIKRQLFIKPHLSPNGYLKLNVWAKGKVRSRPVHRLIAEAFIPNPENKPEVNHKNGNKTDNSVENLEWCTHSENIQHSVNDIKTFPLGEQRKESVLTDEKVKRIRRLKLLGFKQKSIARVFNVSIATVHKIIKGKTWKHVA